MRANNTLVQLFHELTADDCFDCNIQVIDRQRHRTKMIVSAGSLMRDVKPVDDDVAGQNFEATVLERGRIGFDKKADRSPAGSACDGADLWQGYMETLHPEPVHADLRNFDLKISALCGEYLNIRSLNGCLAGQRVGKPENSVPGHVKALCVRFKRPASLWLRAMTGD